jgi:hypothetical protein
VSVGNLESRAGPRQSSYSSEHLFCYRKQMIKLAAIIVALAVPIVILIIHRLGNKDTKLTDRRARAEVMSQLLALSEHEVQGRAVSPTKTIPSVKTAAPGSAPSAKGSKKPTHPGKTARLPAAKSQHA